MGPGSACLDLFSNFSRAPLLVCKPEMLPGSTARCWSGGETKTRTEMRWRVCTFRELGTWGGCHQLVLEGARYCWNPPDQRPAACKPEGLRSNPTSRSACGRCACTAAARAPRVSPPSSVHAAPPVLPPAAPSSFGRSPLAPLEAAPRRRSGRLPVSCLFLAFCFPRISFFCFSSDVASCQAPAQPGGHPGRAWESAPCPSSRRRPGSLGPDTSARPEPRCPGPEPGSAHRAQAQTSPRFPHSGDTRLPHPGSDPARASARAPSSPEVLETEPSPLVPHGPGQGEALRPPGRRVTAPASGVGPRDRGWGSEKPRIFREPGRG